MKTTQVTYGSPERNLGKIAMVQLAKRYRLPIYGLGGGWKASSWTPKPPPRRCRPCCWTGWPA
jgi:hypothetical protein